MAHTIELYNFSKKKNSTATPSNSSLVGSFTNVEPLNESSLVNPVFRLETSALMTARYMVLDSQLYYFIKNVTIYRSGVYDLEGELDVLATWKSDIESSEQYVTRCSDSSKFNTDLYDNIISPSSVVVATLKSEANTSFSLGQRTIVFGFNGSGTESQANVTNFYLTNSVGVEPIFSDVFCDHDIFTNIIQRFQKTSENITMVKAFPFTKGSSTSTSSANVNVGEFTVLAQDLRKMDVSNFSSGDSSIGNVTIASRRFGDVVNISIPSGHYSDYRDYDSNFVDATLHLPFIGNVAIDPQYLRYTTIECTYSIDLITGVGECTVRAIGVDNPKTIGVFNFTAGYDIPISAYVSNIAEIGTQLLSGDYVGATLDAVSKPSSFTTISNGSGMANVYLTKAYLEIKVQGSESPHYGSRKGKKTMKKETISQIATGSYIECLNPSVSTNAFADAKSEIESYMEGGFYYE